MSPPRNCRAKRVVGMPRNLLPASCGSLRAATPEAARGQAEAWLKGVGKTDAATMDQFNKIWSEESSTVLDRVTATLELGDPAAKQLLAEARNANASAPTDVPARSNCLPSVLEMSSLASASTARTIRIPNLNVRSLSS